MAIDLQWLAAIITAITAIVTPVVVCGQERQQAGRTHRKSGILEQASAA
ncbi:hypothetical protein [Solibaculum mannosilyticum]|nr:hypothetical protein BN3661_01799 [Eubacteriaceae bacterium CHKCI005]